MLKPILNLISSLIHNQNFAITFLVGGMFLIIFFIAPNTSNLSKTMVLFPIFIWAVVSFVLFSISHSPAKKIKSKYDTRVIPSEVRKEVWQRDSGRCKKCGSRQHLEFDHIIPVSKGGSNSAKNIELLCRKCNRKKHARIE
jgi:hypothetical protein